MYKILIAEHNASTASFVTGALKKAGHSLTFVDNALDAWRATSRDEYDIMIVDIVMPGIDGFVLAQKALQENPSMQVIFVTGFAAVAMDTYATPSYAPAPVTTRPFHLKDIASRLRVLMGQGAYYETRETAFEEKTTTGTVIYADFAQKTADTLKSAEV